MDLPPELSHARACFAAGDWEQARASLSSLDEDGSLASDDLVLLATAAYLVGRDEQCGAVLERAHVEYLRAVEVPLAVRCAFWLALFLQLRGEMAPAAGWLARAQRLLDDHALDCVEQGYLLLPGGIRSAIMGDFAAAHAILAKAVKVGERFADVDLLALGRASLGRAKIGLGDVAEGQALLDEAMVSVVAGEVSPVPAGVIYCSVIEACHELFDLRRADEWTAALSRWCEASPDLVPFRGQCLVHRSQVMLRRGAWPAAFDEVQRARARLLHPTPQPALGFALYQRADLHRLRGEFADAEQDYRQAHDMGHAPQPGLALLRLAQGRTETAVTSIRYAIEEATDRLGRTRMLGPLVEIMLAAGEVEAARTASDELSHIADDLDSLLLRATAGHASGAVMLAEGDDAAASAALVSACAVWMHLEAPYDHARSRVLLSIARQRLGDTDSAEMELDAARQAFRRLGAAPDLARVDALTKRRPAVAVGGLSPREVEVLGLVAAGLTNKAIAAELFLSEKTVARHISNIFTKLGISSRTAATAFAYQHGLV